jgi:hypothetical protein
MANAMNGHIHRLVNAFRQLPCDFTPTDLERVIASTLSDAQEAQWETIADIACDEYLNEERDRVTLFLANFRGTMH